MSDLGKAFASGYHCLAAWADLLDRINVFPVADSDTGANLRISLAPLRDTVTGGTRTPELLARTAVGNSGNIAAAFFREFCRAQGVEQLAEAAALGRKKSWQALASPRAGTMLNVFDSLVPCLEGTTEPAELYPLISRELPESVRATTEMLPELRQARVVDAGALGMYLFFEGFFRQLAAKAAPPLSILELFAGRLAVSSSFQAGPAAGYCVNAVMQPAPDRAGIGEQLATLGESVIILPSEKGLKLHIHTSDRQQLRADLSSLGTIVHWSDETIDQEISTRDGDPATRPAMHIMTDAAGSISRELARRLFITLLDSYIVAGDLGRPETLCSPAEIYGLMRAGGKVGTAQASVFEREQLYGSVTRMFGRTLYLCVGSVYTGNYDAARRWKEKHDPDNLLEIIDSGAASGRLGLIALLTARYARQGAEPDAIVRFARETVTDCSEYVFIDALRYLVAGGRVSRAGGFLGDLFRMKPVISPTSLGVRKVGVVRNQEEQIAFAMNKLGEKYAPDAAPVIMLQHSDNEEWVAESVMPRVRELLPAAEIMVVPLSLTSGVHMGPGTWSVAMAGGKIT